MGAEEGAHDGEASADDANAVFDRGPDIDVHVIPWDDRSVVSINGSRRGLQMIQRVEEGSERLEAMVIGNSQVGSAPLPTLSR